MNDNRENGEKSQNIFENEKSKYTKKDCIFYLIDKNSSFKDLLNSEDNTEVYFRSDKLTADKNVDNLLKY